MDFSMLFKFKLRNSYSGICMKRKLVFFPNLLALVACGKSGSSDRDLDKTLGFSSKYEAPVPNYEEPSERDQYFQKLKLPYVPPYWINSLEMQDGDAIVSKTLGTHNREFLYYFPETKPSMK